MTSLPLLAFIVLGIIISVVQSLPSTASLHLKSNLGPQNISSGIVIDQDGTRYMLSHLEPYMGLLSATAFAALADKTSGIDQRAGESFLMPVYRKTFPSGATVQLQKDQKGVILYIEIRNVKGKADTYLVKTEDCLDDELLVFSENDVDDTMLREQFDLDEVELQADFYGKESLRGSRAANPRDFVYEQGDGTSSECTYFKVVKIGVVFDSDFCTKYGSNAEARGRIMMIVASASFLFEKDMCVKLRLTDIYTPDNCLASTSEFSSFPREKACGNSAPNTFLKSFRGWMNKNRQSLGFDPDAIFHAFTGFQPQGTLGCAFIGVFCRFPEHSYGVDYMKSDSLQTQSVIFAHEIAHNLNAPHLPAADSNGKRYLMEPALNIPNDGFSQSSVTTILGFLDSSDITCDEIEIAEQVPPPTRHPTQSPTISPSSAPIPPPTRAPAATPIFIEDSPIPCAVQQSDPSPLCVVESSQIGNYICYEAAALMSVRPTPSCELNNPFSVMVFPIACDIYPPEEGASNDAGRSRELKKKGNGGRGGGRGGGGSSVRSDDDAPSQLPSGSPSRNVIIGEDGQAVKATLNDGAQSNDETLASFQSDDCNVGCSMEGDHVCFLAALDESEEIRVYRLRFSVFSTTGTTIFTKDVMVKRNTVSSSALCDIAGSTCKLG